MSKTQNEVISGMRLSHANAFRGHVYPKCLCSDYEVIAVEDSVFDNRIVKKSVVKTVHPQDNFKGLKASDFALENVIAVGAFDSLTECKLGFGTRGETSDNLEGAIDNVISAVDAAESETIQNNE